MLISRMSPITNRVNQMDLPITEDQLARWEGGEGLVQNVFPNLTPDQREFLMTGILADEWDQLFEEEE